MATGSLQYVVDAAQHPTAVPVPLDEYERCRAAGGTGGHSGLRCGEIGTTGRGAVREGDKGSAVRAGSHALRRRHPEDGPEGLVADHPSRRARTHCRHLRFGRRPSPIGCMRLVLSDAWRIRIGAYRVIYEISDEQLTVLVVAVGHRSDVYGADRLSAHRSVSCCDPPPHDARSDGLGVAYQGA